MHTALDNTPPHELARLVIEAFVLERRTIEPPRRPQGVLAGRAGVFVSLHIYDGDLRGCIGTLLPVRATVAEEVIHNAISAAVDDPRFSPVSPDELQYLKYGVDVLSPPELISGPEDLDPALYGVAIKKHDGSRRGLLLPAIPGIETVEEQWRTVHLKANIRLGAAVQVERFTVTRFGK
ncbi:MAG TPA: AmmeMemoRadiSam system protein A [Blastocatellia bacterium]|nr:AmmeMemoRadiSam system protein A [Blastocatellia bacterium]